MSQLFSVTTKKKQHALERGGVLDGYVIKTSQNEYQIIIDGRVRNISRDELRVVMGYPALFEK